MAETRDSSRDDERREYRKLVLFVWVVLPVGTALSVLLVLNGVWWAALTPIAVVIGSPLIFQHFTGFERHQRALNKKARR
jgi:hypothetical protein